MGIFGFRKKGFGRLIRGFSEILNRFKGHQILENLEFFGGQNLESLGFSIRFEDFSMSLSESWFDGCIRWSRIALRQFSREKRKLLSLKIFWPGVSERRDGREMKKQGSSKAFIRSLKCCVLQSDPS